MGTPQISYQATLTAVSRNKAPHLSGLFVISHHTPHNYSRSLWKGRSSLRRQSVHAGRLTLVNTFTTKNLATISVSLAFSQLSWAEAIRIGPPDTFRNVYSKQASPSGSKRTVVVGLRTVSKQTNVTRVPASLWCLPRPADKRRASASLPPLLDTLVRAAKSGQCWARFIR